MTQTWSDLLFAHWPFAPDVLAQTLPRGIELDLYEGRAWLSIVPFRMSNVAPRSVQALPWISAFPELNVRTYVRVHDKPGVFFYSLDATNPLAVHTARTVFHLPYYKAEITVEAEDCGIRYRSRRSRALVSAEFVGTYAPTGLAASPVPGTLEHFLTERYCLYTTNRQGRVYRLEIHHPPWPLQPARVDIAVNTMAAAAGLTLPDVSPLVHFSRRQDVVAWRMRTV
jgi:uncharacterized protein